MLDIYKGFKQATGETVQTFLERTRDVGEDAWGPSSGWTMSQASLLIKKICDGFLSSELAKLTASVVISVPFQWNVLCDSILQFQQRVKTSHPEQSKEKRNRYALSVEEITAFETAGCWYVDTAATIIKVRIAPRKVRKRFASSARASLTM